MLRISFPYIEVGLIIRAPSRAVWDILIDTSCWPEWGPSIRAVECSDLILTAKSFGYISTILGFSAPFSVTHFEPARTWSWSVFGVPATTHRVEELGKGFCRLIFGVPVLAFPYLLICTIAIRRIARLAESQSE